MGIFKNIVGNIPGGNFLGGNSPEGSLIGGNFPGGNFPGESFPDTQKIWATQKKTIIKAYDILILVIHLKKLRKF